MSWDDKVSAENAWTFIYLHVQQQNNDDGWAIHSLRWSTHVRNVCTLSHWHKFTKKQEAKREKELLKQKKRAEKLRIKNEKEVEKQLRKDEKKRIKSSKKKKESKTEIDLGIAKIEIKNNTFSDIINRVKKRNKLKPYPDINKTID